MYHMLHNAVIISSVTSSVFAAPGKKARIATRAKESVEARVRTHEGDGSAIQQWMPVLRKEDVPGRY
jgi:hypothetical protein